MGYTGMPFYPMKFGRATPRMTTATQTSRRRTTTAMMAKTAQPPRSSKKSKVFPFRWDEVGMSGVGRVWPTGARRLARRAGAWWHTPGRGATRQATLVEQVR